MGDLFRLIRAPLVHLLARKRIRAGTARLTHQMDYNLLVELIASKATLYVPILKHALRSSKLIKNSRVWPTRLWLIATATRQLLLPWKSCKKLCTASKINQAVRCLAALAKWVRSTAT